ncbi:leucyl/phenylalanyl-tRNA--protein transferase [uncultured Castellaniella sp.]|uniref:leucyl/phenylalanyl-tRNA--protein transferase n=1 Tax=uncultured Castellaniella sp. TaxID=647907 RepID=UPI00263846E4|nr:leucyl/phenylalanyl-tRNA--protein transferase [uncultured Castellaniella sp.]
MPIAWVEPDAPLPDISRTSPDGLVAAGLDLSPARLQEAYRKSLFPWYSPGDPVLWWSPDPRMVLRCQDLRISHSLAKRIRQFGRAQDAGQRADDPDGALRVTLNLAFPDVMAHCARRGAPRIGLGRARAGGQWAAPEHPTGRDATWITPDIIQVYTAWHRMGRVHSVETWVDGRLAGGLYGVSLGRCFFGESMFSLAADASKVALAYLVRYLLSQGVPWIDCQQETPHLASLGARPIARAEFLGLLADGRDAPPPAWGRGRLLADGRLIPA